MRLFAISDIHGCAQTFRELLEKIGLNQDDHLVLVGDYIDRGPDTKGVIDQILFLREKGYAITTLKGNHEDLMLEALENEEYLAHWISNGGQDTLHSFGIASPNDLSPFYLDFFRDLKNFHETEEAFFVHAGFNFRAADPLEDKTAMLWIRHWYDQLDREWLDDRLIVHGHTPQPRPRIELQLDLIDRMPVLDIDCGCVYPREHMHQLCAFDLTNRCLHFVRNRESVSG
jgi:serine/threonine protein phosphatase 1